MMEEHRIYPLEADTGLLDVARGYVKQRNELRHQLQENIKQGVAVHRSLALLQELDEQEMFEQKLDEMLLDDDNLVETKNTSTPDTKPEKIWSNPGSFDGEWLYPEWRTDHWEFIAR